MSEEPRVKVGRADELKYTVKVQLNIFCLSVFGLTKSITLWGKDFTFDL